MEGMNLILMNNRHWTKDYKIEILFRGLSSNNIILTAECECRIKKSDENNCMNRLNDSSS